MEGEYGRLVKPFAMNEVKKAPRTMKNGKASIPSEIFREHLAASPHGKL